MLKINSTHFKLIFWTTGLTYLLCVTGCADTSTSGQAFQDQQNLTPTTKTLFTMAEILAAQGKDQECEFTLKRIIQQNPEYIPAYNSLAELKMRQGKIKIAMETINQAFRFSPDDPILLNNLGLCWLTLGEYEQALDIFTQATGAVPENARYRANMALALGLLGRNDEALSLYSQILPQQQAQQNAEILQQAWLNNNIQ